MIYDFIVIGGGIIGLATAHALSKRQPGSSILLLEKESEFAKHQTGHNSGVIHAGVYYAPGSLKARLCKIGAEATKTFCRENGIEFNECGKLLVATNELEMQRMDALAERVRQNGLEFTRLNAEQLAEEEPNINGVGALLVPSTGIVSYQEICRVLANNLAAHSTEFRLGMKVKGIREEADSVVVRANDEEFRGRKLIACAGLQADRIARLANMELDSRIVPFRGEYYRLPAEKNNVVKHLIYPIPDPELPFLGIHLTRMIDGSVTVGPNAVLGLAREGYPRLSINFRDLASMLLFPGFWKLIAKNLRSGLTETGNSIWKPGYLQQCRKYCPSLSLSDLKPYPAGIRAQAVRSDGTLVEDFLFVESDRMLHVINAPSPAATSAFPIGEMIADKLEGLESPLLQ